MHYFKNLSKRFSSKKNNIIGKQIKAVKDEQKKILQLIEKSLGRSSISNNLMSSWTYCLSRVTSGADIRLRESKLGCGMGSRVCDLHPT